MEAKVCASCPAMDKNQNVCRRKPAVDGWPPVDPQRDWCLEGRSIMQAMEMDRLREEMMKAETGQRAAVGMLRGW